MYNATFHWHFCLKISWKPPSAKYTFSVKFIQKWRIIEERKGVLTDAEINKANYILLILLEWWKRSKNIRFIPISRWMVHKLNQVNSESLHLKIGMDWKSLLWVRNILHEYGAVVSRIWWAHLEEFPRYCSFLSVCLGCVQWRGRSERVVAFRECTIQ